MSDVIYRQKAVDAMQKYDFFIPSDMRGGFISKLRDAIKADLIDAVREVPSAEPEQKTGTWVESEGADDGYCSECKCSIPMFIVDWKWKYQKTPYCPNCGAKMKNSVD